VKGLLRIRRVEPLDGLGVRLTLTDGRTVERDLDLLMVGRVFAGIRRDRVLFAKARVRHGTIRWPGDVDLDPDVVIWGGPPPVNDAVPPAHLAPAVPR
jgi:hypothetical protein